ncbi:MAG: FKBP-type peptidyl-prolyl cis-trans isomerase [Planctomycetia bacterium]
MNGRKAWFVSLASTVASAMVTACLAAGPEVVPPPSSAADSDSDSDSGGLESPGAKLGYAVGLRIGSRIAADFKAEHPDMPRGALARGLADAVRGKPPAIPDEDIQQALQQFDAMMERRGEEFAKRMEAAAKANLDKAKEFLRGNASKTGIVALPSGLQYQVLREGTGPRPTPDDVVATWYRGTHLDGTEFDATDPKGEPATFPVRGVVPGWQEALPLMKVGSKWRLFVPPELGYGEEGSPPVIEPNELLVFEIELVRIVPRK